MEGWKKSHRVGKGKGKYAGRKGRGQGGGKEGQGTGEGESLREREAGREGERGWPEGGGVEDRGRGGGVEGGSGRGEIREEGSDFLLTLGFTQLPHLITQKRKYRCRGECTEVSDSGEREGNHMAAVS